MTPLGEAEARLRQRQLALRLQRVPGGAQARQQRGGPLALAVGQGDLRAGPAQVHLGLQGLRHAAARLQPGAQPAPG